MVAGARGEPEAIPLARGVLAEIDALGDRRRVTTRTDVAVIFMNAGLWEEARTMFMQASEEARALGGVFLINLVDANACWLDLLEQRYDAAAAGFRSVLEVARRLGYASWEGDTLRGLGLALVGLGRRAEARTSLTSALEILAADPTPNTELTATLLWIALATEPTEAPSAARLTGAVAAVRRNARLTAWPGEPELRRRFEQPLIEALGEDGWAREQAAGATLTLADAIELARTLATPIPETTPHSA